ncbi:MAG: ABC transporter ATP-binding protein [Anaerolineae bacterium]|nr:ABC transporter ATP-binding protein [Anaerolineae bacterium]MDW8171957.1 ABC transporter ATP-binding protein [Anaerolineae bacterium]
MSEFMVRARQVVKDYRMGEEWVRVLHGIDLDVPRGQFLAIMGTSGSGKSTLLYQLGGLDRPSSGRIMVHGRRLDALNSAELARLRRDEIGFIFQSANLIPTLSAWENVALPGIFAGIDADERQWRAVRLLKGLDMGDRVEHRPSQLSGGQQQRVAIARALFNNPPILMADEPTAALDSKTSAIVFQWLRRLADQGRTVIVVSHDEDVMDYADRIVRLRDGRMIDDHMTHTRRSAAQTPVERAEQQEELL